MTHTFLKRATRAARRGMTLIEVMIAIVIMSGAMLGLANFGRKFQHTATTTALTSLASDLATLRIEQVKAWRVYSTLVANFNGVTEVFTDPIYGGFTRKTVATRCTGCPTASNDYITVSVTVSGNNVLPVIEKTTIIAVF
jgi:prepilin-type N-terminal cleavage/methylation domain-containing protein